MFWPGLLILNFERIRTDGPAQADLFTSPSASPVPFESDWLRRLEWLKAFANVLSEERLVQLIARGAPLPARSVLLSFSGGYRHHYTVVARVLRQLGLPAIFQVPVRAIDERQLPAADVLPYMIRLSRFARIRFQGRAYLTGPRANLTVARLRTLLHAKRLRGDSTVQDFLAELSFECGVPLPSPAVQNQELMTWDELEELAECGFAIGALGYGGFPMSGFDLRRQRLEVNQARSVLQAHLGAPARTFMYPGEGFESHFIESQELVRQAGFSLGVSQGTGFNLGALDPYDLRSVPGAIAGSALMARAVRVRMRVAMTSAVGLRPRRPGPDFLPRRGLMLVPPVARDGEVNSGS